MLVTSDGNQSDLPYKINCMCLCCSLQNGLYKFLRYRLNELSKINDLNERLVCVQNMKRQFEMERAMLPVSRFEQLTLTMEFLMDTVKTLEEEELCIKKELNKTQQPITYSHTSQHRQEAEEGNLQGRCFGSTSNHKKNDNEASAVVEGSSDENNLSGHFGFSYSQQLPMIERSLYRHERRMRGDDVNMSPSPMQGLASGDEHTLPNARDKGKGVSSLGKF